MYRDRTCECLDALPTIVASGIMLPIMTAIAIFINGIYFKVSFGFLAVLSVYLLYKGFCSITIFDKDGFRFFLHKELHRWDSITDAEMCTEYRYTHNHGRRKITYLAVFTEKYHVHPKKKGASSKEKAITIGGPRSIELFEKYIHGYRPDLAVRYPYEGEYYES